ncbi:MAG: WG repeat-containing protein [Rhodothermales bacterium]|nr:WG repeat-containing protein [Rhodothermales bacterium]
MKMSTRNPDRILKLLMVGVLLSSATLLNGCDMIPGIGDSDDDVVSFYPVLLDGEWGFINSNGRMVIEPDFRSAGSFSEGLAPVRSSSRFGYIDRTGEYAIEPRFEYAEPFSDGVAAVRIDGRWGYIDKNGSVVINPTFVNAGPFSDDRAFVRTAEYDWEYIDSDGEIVRTSETPRLDNHEYTTFSEGVALYEGSDDSYGFIDRDGNPVIPAQYASARAFSEGKAAIKISDRWGFIDRQKKTVISPKYISAGSFGNKLAPVRDGGNSWGYVDATGTMVIQPSYEDARSFNDGVAAVMMNQKWGYIDRDGNQLVATEFDEVSDFENGMGRVVRLVGERTTFGYVDAHGKYVWFPTD